MYHLCQEAERSGDRTVLLYAIGKPWQSRLTTFIRIPMPRVSIPWQAAREILFAFGCWRALQSLNEPTDVVHTHGGPVLAAVGSLIARRNGARSVHTIHASMGRPSGLRKLLYKAWRLPDVVIGVSPRIARELASYVGRRDVLVQSSGVRCQGWGTHQKAVHRRTRVLEPWTVVSVGRLHPVKGHEYLVRAVAQLPGRFRIILVGDGEMRAFLERLSRRLQVHVEFLGQRPYAEIPEILQEADVFVLPSITLPGQAEGTPTALLEAFAVGVPAVATDTGGVRDLYEEGFHMQLVPERDPDALARAIQRVITRLSSEPEQVWKEVEQNRTLVQARTWPRVYERIRSEAYCSEGRSEQASSGRLSGGGVQGLST